MCSIWHIGAMVHCNCGELTTCLLLNLLAIVSVYLSVVHFPLSLLSVLMLVVVICLFVVIVSISNGFVYNFI